jgi:hypothetical protein
MNRLEDYLQKSVAEFLRLALKKPDRFWFCPNGGNLSKAQAGKFKAMGLTAGVPDLHFIWASGSRRQFPCYGTIELKAGKNDATAEQLAFQKDMTAIGWPHAECRTVEQVETTLRSWEVPLHATVLRSGVIKTAARG